jgi:alpha-tubulin suppressor-like RCC1 family protein
MKQSITAVAAFAFLTPFFLQAQSQPVRRSLVAGDHHNLVLRADDTLWAWGANSAGQLGRGNTADSGTPMAVTLSSGVIFNLASSPAGGRAHTLAVRPDADNAQALWSWGENTTQQLGINGSTASRLYPGYVIRADGSHLIGLKEIAGGGDHTVAINANGNVIAWGSNLYGQLGYGVVDSTAPAFRSEPVLVRINSTTNLSNVTAIRAGRHHSLALTSGGSVYAWGRTTGSSLGMALQIPHRCHGRVR